MSSLGLAGSATYSQTLSGIEQMMEVLPDNTSNQISAQNMRDVVLTLYEDIQAVSASASITQTGFLYTNGGSSTVEVGGWPIGSTFNNVPLESLFNGLFYKYVPPTISISPSPSQLEFGNTQQVTLTMNVTARRNTVLSGNLFKPAVGTTNNPNPDPIILATLSSGDSFDTSRAAYPIPNTLTTFTFSVSDLNTSVTPNTGSSNNIATCQIVWRNRIYWGTINLPGNPNLTINPSATSSISSLFTDGLILGLTGADGTGTGSELSTTLAQTRTMTGGGNYLVFSWPTSFGTPTFYTGSPIPNTAFTKIRSNSPFVNGFSYSANYDVWVSNTEYYESTLINIT